MAWTQFLSKAGAAFGREALKCLFQLSVACVPITHQRGFDLAKIHHSEPKLLSIGIGEGPLMNLHLSNLRWLGTAAIAGCLSLVVMTPAFAVDTLTVTVDQAKIVKLPPNARTLIIGNPMIADVTLLKNGTTMIVTGKGFGETNMIALDGAGSPVAESNIVVVGNNKALVLQRGMDRESYTCAPRCQPTALLGDDSKFFSDVTSQIQAHNSDALGK